LIARQDKPVGTLDEMMEALKQFSTSDEDKLKISVD
jgi:hypothetical protein